ncbi:hypothetical protein JCGZ_20286 [Jatropha curcas]|uniref:BHLH domain-containing protein n=1 Tax=Jatropha curcas TaxID=180498 RepID=A0A067JWZ3_JATCU|nr:transcription factor bHLH117 [Jatropha curcas]KDP27298.1 hypothetical protein JCGZ_20286 [Jatropha curcas]
MDRDFKPSFSSLCDAASSASLFPPPISTDVVPDDSPFSSVFSDVTVQTLIPLASDCSIGTSSLLDFPAYYTATHSHQLGDNLFFNSDSQLTRSNFFSANLKIPKKEPLSYFNLDESALITELTQPLDFFSKNLPSLQSSESPPSKHPFDSRLTNLNSSPPSASLSTAVTPQKQVEKRRRKRMSDKFHHLQKLLPLDKKMDTATMLAEAYKYVKFLQAQVKALQAMATDSSFSGDVGGLGSLFGKMEMLSRQQVLQVLLNTPEAQSRLYSQRCCVYSIEQLVILKKVAERRALFNQQVILDTRRN